MGKFSRTWELMGMSWQVLKKDKEMLLFPFLSMICCLAVLMLGFVIVPALGPFFWGGLAVAYVVILALTQSALQSIFQPALYLYAREGKIAEGFSTEVLLGAMRRK